MLYSTPSGLYVFGEGRGQKAMTSAIVDGS